MHTIKLETVKIDGKAFYGIAFPYDKQLIEKAKKLKGRWNPKLQLWVFSYTKIKHEQLNKTFELSKPIPKPNHTKVPQAYLDQLERRRYSPNTIQTYVSLFEKFLAHFSDVPPEKLTNAHVAQFQTYLVKRKKVSTSSQNQCDQILF